MRIIEVKDLSDERPYDRLVTMVALVEAPQPPSPKDVAALVRYHADGYGCYDGQVEGIPGRDGLWTVTWRRGKSCD